MKVLLQNKLKLAVLHTHNKHSIPLFHTKAPPLITGVNFRLNHHQLYMTSTLARQKRVYRYIYLCVTLIQRVRMYYRSGTGGTLLHSRRTDASCSFTRWQHFSAWNNVMAAIFKVWRQVENPTPSMCTYLKSIPAKCQPDPIWNDGDAQLPTSTYVDA